MPGKYKEEEFDNLGYEEFYENHHFQHMGENDYLNINESFPRFGWAFDTVEEVGAKSMLDLGCLDGSLILTCVKKLGVNGTGVDLSKHGISIAEHRAKEKGLNATFIQGKIEELLGGFIAEGRKFDVVTCMEVIEHVDSPEELISLIDQVLAPGGTVVMSTPSFESPKYGMNDEGNKCHVRLYTTKEEDYEAVNMYGNTRKATSIIKQIGKDRIRDIGIFSELIHVRYQ